MNAKRILVAVMAVAFLLSATAVAGELKGVTLPDTMTVGGNTLKLNGMGLRKKGGLIKVYVGGLYLVTPSKDADAVIAADAPKAVTMHFVRNVDKGKLLDAYKEGFENTAKGLAAAQQASVDRFLSFVTDMKDGEEVTYIYDPASGLSVKKGGQLIGTIENKEFGKGVFALWLGVKPPSKDFKNGLLGITD